MLAVMLDPRHHGTLFGPERSLNLHVQTLNQFSFRILSGLLLSFRQRFDLRELGDHVFEKLAIDNALADHVAYSRTADYGAGCFFRVLSARVFPRSTS